MGERFKGRGEKDVRASAAPAGGEKTSVKRPRKKVAGERVSCYDKDEWKASEEPSAQLAAFAESVRGAGST